MLKSHEKFHSSNGKRLILVADDESINREILGALLEEEYEVIFAEDGLETMEKVKSFKDDLSLLLLDLMMPKKPGMEVLRDIKEDPELKHIPVIVLTADQNAEVESLTLGAIDYIPKPYPQASIIKARIVKAIELSEDRDIIQSTERDPLTGLYNREYFYRYAEQYDQHHKDVETDAIVVDINHFHMINERFGNAYGDMILKRVGERIREAVSEVGGIVCRREADTFMVYCPSGLDHKLILDNATIGLGDDESINSHVRLRLGVYANVDKSLDIERRFDRAKMAADTVRNSYNKTIGIYDNKMHERELYAEQLVDDFHKAIEEEQFKVYFQPKFDVRPKSPVLVSAEALVRWQHPSLGMISPGVFIPLFEENGLIQELDYYVWTKSANQMRDWEERYGFHVPVSVNVSRIDIYDPELVEKLEKILDDNNLTSYDILLEITESAYTQNSDQIVKVVNRLRSLGFRVEMDDFGTGYSSLNMISDLPIDALKLDMQFVRNAFKDQKDTRMLEVIIDIADHLDVPVIAEGVETEEQMLALKALGCDIVQGYYFSKPIPPEAFDEFIAVRKDLGPEALKPEIIDESKKQEVFEKPEAPKRRIPLKAVNYAFVIVAFILAIILIITDVFISRSHNEMDIANEKHRLATQAANDLEAGSDYLTVSVRSFVVTGDIKYLDDYFEEADVTKSRDQAVESLKMLLDGSDSNALLPLTEALDTSNELMELEYNAMRLAQIAGGIADSRVPESVSSFSLSAAERGLSKDGKLQRAEDLVFGDEYLKYKEKIRDSVDLCSSELIEKLGSEMKETRKRMDRLMTTQTVVMSLMMLAVLGEVIFVTKQIRIPLSRMVSYMRAQTKIPPSGASELRFVTETYNEILEEHKNATRQLSYEASHDALTGLLNRSAYEMFMDTVDKEHIALIIVDVDKFKSINDTYGHDVGDRVLKQVAKILTANFRSVDAVCRIGGDEFVVVMTRANSSMGQLVKNKIANANQQLQNPTDGLPKVSLSVGVAFSDRENPSDSIFRDADTALYTLKRSGRGGCCIYSELQHDN